MIAYSVLWLLRVDSWVYTWNQRGAEDDISRAFIDMRCRKFCIRNGVTNGSNIYNVVSDEYFKQRLKRYKPWMQPEIGQISTWFCGGTCFRWDLSRSACGRCEKAIHRIESTGSCIWSYVDQSERQATAFYSQARRQASLSNWPTGGERSLSLPCLMLVNLMTHNRVRLLILMSWQMLVALKPLLTLLIHIVNLINLSIRFWHCWFTI